VTDGVVQGIIGFVGGVADTAGSTFRDALRQRVPPYMIPGTIHTLSALPLTTSGKVDRRALLDWLDAGKGVA
jgi:acyl-coenzyme A synthetase/AMP-(fatty) acid ligase